MEFVFELVDEVTLFAVDCCLVVFKSPKFESSMKQATGTPQTTFGCAFRQGKIASDEISN